MFPSFTVSSGGISNLRTTPGWVSGMMLGPGLTVDLVNVTPTWNQGRAALAGGSGSQQSTAMQQWAYNAEGKNATVNTVDLPVNFMLTVNETLMHGYTQSDMQLSLQGLSPLLAPLNITPSVSSGALLFEGALDQPSVPWVGSTMVSLTLPNGGVALGGRSGQYMNVDVQRVRGWVLCVKRLCCMRSVCGVYMLCDVHWCVL